MGFLLLLTFGVALVALIYAVNAAQRASRAEAKADFLKRELDALKEKLEPALPAPQPHAPKADTPKAVRPQPATPAEQPHPVAPPAPPRWPEDQPAGDVFSPAPPPPAATPTAAKPRGPSLWGPEFSRARISVIGGALVLGGLAFTLHALGLPAWTLLLAVFAFGALLYGTARLVPWPVSGALRGLGYGVTALGIGSLAQKLPQTWGPGAVLVGLLLLSAALTWDGLRRREPLLGVLAVGGATLSVWMLADDLGRVSILTMSSVFLLVSAAVAGGWAFLNRTDPEADAQDRPDAPETWRAAVALTLGIAGVLPLGWLFASLGHVVQRSFAGREMLAEALYLSGDALTGMLAWAAFGLLALTPVLALLRRRVQPTQPLAENDPLLRLSTVWATLLPQALVALAVGQAVNTSGQHLGVVGVGLALIAVLGGAAWQGWPSLGGRAGDPENTLTGAISGSLTAAASSLAAALLVALLGARTEPAALAGLALVLLLVGVQGRSWLWQGVGALGLALTAWWGILAPFASVDAQFSDPLTGALLSALPALIGLTGAWRLAAPWPKLALGLAGLCSAAVVLGIAAGPSWLLLLGTVLLAGLLWTTPYLKGSDVQASDLTGSGTVLTWAALPGLVLGGGLLLAAAEPEQRVLPLLGSLFAALTLLFQARQAGRVRMVVEGLGLALLTLTLALALDMDQVSLTLPLALTTLVAAWLPLRLPSLRVDLLLLLGVLSGLQNLTDHQWPVAFQPLNFVGTLTLLAAWWLTRHPAGQVYWRSWRGDPAALEQHPAPLRVWELAVLLGLAMTAGELVTTGLLEWWMLLASAACLLLGLLTCVGANRQPEQPVSRPLWTAGLSLIVAAGIKAATIDALLFQNIGAVAGLAVLVTGLCLLLVAIVAPRPAPPGPEDPDEVSHLSR